MNPTTVTINQTALTIKEHQSQRVVTLKEIDTVHRRPEGTARRNFTTNRAHFIEGVDFFTILWYYYSVVYSTKALGSFHPSLMNAPPVSPRWGVPMPSFGA